MAVKDRKKAVEVEEAVAGDEVMARCVVFKRRRGSR